MCAAAFWLAVSVCAGTVFAAFDNLGTGARAAGMGGASAGFAGGVYSADRNPAGICGLKGLEVAGEGADLLRGLDDGSSLGSMFAAAGMPLGERFALGLNFRDLALTDVYSEHTVKVTAGMKVADFLYAGLNLKSFTQKYTLNAYYTGDGVFSGGSTASAVDADAGLLFRPPGKFSAGISAVNILRGTYGLGNAAGSFLPQEYTLGTAYSENGMNLAADITCRTYNADGQGNRDENYRLCAGMEKWFMESRTYEGLYLAALRFGIGWDLSEALINKKDNYKHISAGAGFNVGWFEVDYGFTVPLGDIEGINGTHRFSFLLKFGKIYKKKAMVTTKEAPSGTEGALHLPGMGSGPAGVDGKTLEEIRKQAEEKARKELEPEIREEVESEARKQAEKELRELREKLEKQAAEAAGKTEGKEEPEALLKEVPEEKVRAVTVRRYTVKEGDTLISLSKEFYGDERKWVIIYEANKDRIEKGVLRPGQVLAVPE